MAKVKVKVTGAYVDGKAPGSELSIEEKSAEHLEQLGYVERVKQSTKKQTQAKKKADEEKPESDK